MGSANLDNRTFRLNFEVAAIIYCERTNAELAKAFTRDLQDSREVRRDELGRQPLRQRFGQAGARLLSPLL